MMIDESIVELQEVAQKSASRAGQLLREQWQKPRQIENKGYRDLVTDSDFAAQKLITDLIQDHFPTHGFMTEENNPDLPRAGPILWVIDPVDGTINYSQQVPTFCVSIAAVSTGDMESDQTLPSGTVLEDRVLAGVIYDPLRDEMFSAAKGRGSSMNGAVIHASKTPDLETSMVGVDWSHRYERRQAMLEAVASIAHQVRTIRAFGSAALALAWVGAGRLDVYYNLGLHPWDVAAASLIIHEAGGRLTNTTGKPWQLGNSGCLASNGMLHEKLQLFLSKT